MPTRSRLAIYAVIGALLAAFSAVDIVLSPLGTGVENNGLGRLLGAATLMGVLVAQPILAAMVTLFWPARGVLRVAVGLMLACLIVYAFVLGESPSPRPNSLLAPGFMYAAFLLPLFALRWLRGWRVVSPLAPSTDHDRRFSLRTLLAIVTMACVVLAAGRWTVEGMQWPNDRAMWLDLWQSTATFGCVGAAVFLVMVPGMAWALGEERRAVACLAMLAGILALTIGMTALEVASSNPSELPTIVSINTGLAVGAFGSILLTLFALRCCGFRLVRKVRAIPNPRPSWERVASASEPGEGAPTLAFNAPQKP